jgi:aminoglycoside phosphotransferase (APT) family kinase protein
MNTDFDPARLKAFLADALGGDGAMRIARIAGGQSNPTYFVDFGPRRLVLRKRPAGQLAPSAHAIDREYRVLKALGSTAVPVPGAVLYHDADDVVGTPFYLMERLEGRVFHDCALPEAAPADRAAMYRSMALTLAALHSVDFAAVGLGGYGRPGDYFERQISRWSKQWEASPSRPDFPEIDPLVVWLKANKPADDGAVSIVHGDFRIGNMMFHPSEPRVIAVLDWELSTLGHPLADLGFSCLPWHTWPDEYGGILGKDRAALALPTKAEYVAAYAGAMPRLAPLADFHVVFALFRFAMIFVGIADRARLGTAAAADASEVGWLAGRFARRALDLAEGRPPQSPGRG